MTTGLTNTIIMAGFDIIAIAILIFGLYFPRYKRADLIAPFLGVNIGVFAVAMTLAQSTVSAGLGLGLFGVLSIIRLRSSEITQSEIAYYFSALAIGLLAGMSTSLSALALGGTTLILLALAIGDSRTLFGGYDSQQVYFDRVIADPEKLSEAISQSLGIAVIEARIKKLDLVNDLTVVNIRYRVQPTRTRRKTKNSDLAEFAISHEKKPSFLHGAHTQDTQ